MVEENIFKSFLDRNQQNKQEMIQPSSMPSEELLQQICYFLDSYSTSDPCSYAWVLVIIQVEVKLEMLLFYTLRSASVVVFFCSHIGKSLFKFFSVYCSYFF